MKLKTVYCVVAAASLALGMVGVMAGCGKRSTAEEALRKFMPTYCDKLKECVAEGFAAAYPNGKDQCVQKAVDALAEADRTKSSACTDAEIDTCTKDVGALACSAVTTASALPTSCSKC